jgi:hypothetical protein
MSPAEDTLSGLYLAGDALGSAIGRETAIEVSRVK